MNDCAIKKQFLSHKTSWINSAKFGISLDHDLTNIPWYSYPAIDFLKKTLQPNHVVFEFGCGSSTIFYQRHVGKIIALETNRRWFNIIVLQALKNNSLAPQHSQNYLLENNYFRFENLEIILMEDGINNIDYEKFAINYSLRHNLKFDFIVIDSLKRFASATNSISAINKGGWLILDDAERQNYQKIISFFKEHNFTDTNFLGIAPAQLKIKNTCFFNKI